MLPGPCGPLPGRSRVKLSGRLSLSPPFLDKMAIPCAGSLPTGLFLNRLLPKERTIWTMLFLFNWTISSGPFGKPKRETERQWKKEGWHHSCSSPVWVGESVRQRASPDGLDPQRDRTPRRFRIFVGGRDYGSQEEAVRARPVQRGETDVEALGLCHNRPGISGSHGVVIGPRALAQSGERCRG